MPPSPRRASPSDAKLEALPAAHSLSEGCLALVAKVVTESDELRTHAARSAAAHARAPRQRRRTSFSVELAANPSASPLAAFGPREQRHMLSFLSDELALSASPKAAPLPFMLFKLTLRGTNAQQSAEYV